MSKKCHESDVMTDHNFVYVKEPKIYLLNSGVVKEVIHCTECNAAVSSEHEDNFIKMMDGLGVKVGEAEPL